MSEAEVEKTFLHLSKRTSVKVKFQNKTYLILEQTTLVT